MTTDSTYLTDYSSSKN